MASGIDLLLAEHELVDQLFDEFESTGEGPLVGRIIDALTAHDDAEHAALYPMVGALVGDSGMVARCDVAHSAIKRQIDVIKSLEGPALSDAVARLRVLVADHVRDEETNVFPALASVATTDVLELLGARLLQAKQRVG